MIQTSVILLVVSNVGRPNLEIPSTEQNAAGTRVLKPKNTLPEV